MIFDDPLWLWGILVPLIGFVLFITLRRKSLVPGESLVAERLRHRLVLSASVLPRWVAFLVLTVAFLIIILAISRPQIDEGVEAEKSEGRNVLLALDLSKSMRTSDVNPDRLSQAKLMIIELLERMEQDRVGLIGFAGTANLVAPLTIDHAAVRQTLEQLDENWISSGGSDIAAALKLATKTLKETGQKSNVLVIFSDGEEHQGDLAAMISEAERAGVKVLAIGMGTTEGAFVPDAEAFDGLMKDEDGARVLSRLRPEKLKDIADGTGGNYIRAEGLRDISDFVKQAMAGMDTFIQESGQRRVLREMFQWLLVPAVLLMFVFIIGSTRWHGLMLIGGLTVLQIGISPQAHADEASALFQKGEFLKAGEAFLERGSEERAEIKNRSELGAGIAFYRAEKFREARSAYSVALQSKREKIKSAAHQGMGNTLFQLGWLGLADSAYPANPEEMSMERFDQLVAARLAKMAEARVPLDGETSEYVRFRSIIENWTDSIRHYHSVGENSLTDQNTKLIYNYLVRLEELLKQEEEETGKELQQLQPAPGEGTGEPDENGEPGEGGDEESEEQEPGEGDEGDDGEQPDQEGEESDGDDGKEEEGDPNESPTDGASRILEENSDQEKGPLNPGRTDYLGPKKDW